jgi:uncharacterized protein YjiS (DUF1127 family)
MAQEDPTREFRRVMSEIASLNARILDHVYRKAWDRNLLSRLREEVDAKKAELEQLRASLPRRPDRAPSASHAAGEDALDTHDTRLIANALYTQRPLVYESDEWPAYRRVCASLVRLFAHELHESGDFDSVEFLTHCGLSREDAEEISRRPGDFIRRSEESWRE